MSHIVAGRKSASAEAIFNKNKRKEEEDSDEDFYKGVTFNAKEKKSEIGSGRKIKKAAKAIRTPTFEYLSRGNDDLDRTSISFDVRSIKSAQSGPAPRRGRASSEKSTTSKSPRKVFRFIPNLFKGKEEKQYSPSCILEGEESGLKTYLEVFDRNLEEVNRKINESVENLDKLNELIIIQKLFNELVISMRKLRKQEKLERLFIIEKNELANFYRILLQIQADHVVWPFFDQVISNKGEQFIEDIKFILNRRDVISVTNNFKFTLNKQKDFSDINTDEILSTLSRSASFDDNCNAAFSKITVFYKSKKPMHITPSNRIQGKSEKLSAREWYRQIMFSLDSMGFSPDSNPLDDDEYDFLLLLFLPHDRKKKESYQKLMKKYERKETLPIQDRPVFSVFQRLSNSAIPAVREALVEIWPFLKYETKHDILCIHKYASPDKHLFCLKFAPHKIDDRRTTAEIVVFNEGKADVIQTMNYSFYLFIMELESRKRVPQAEIPILNFDIKIRVTHPKNNLSTVEFRSTDLKKIENLKDFDEKFHPEIRILQDAIIKDLQLLPPKNQLSLVTPEYSPIIHNHF